ncbi:hypothetical protein [Luteimonas sp. TWI406]
MLTARRDTPDRVRGLNEGADAYLAKPVEIDLLAATLHSLARRLHGDAPSPAPADGWRLADNGWRLVGSSGHGAALTKSERRMLQCPVEAEGETVARDRLIAAVSDNVHDFDPATETCALGTQLFNGADVTGLASNGEGALPLRGAGRSHVDADDAGRPRQRHPARALWRTANVDRRRVPLGACGQQYRNDPHHRAPGGHV